MDWSEFARNGSWLNSGFPAAEMDRTAAIQLRRDTGDWKGGEDLMNAERDLGSLGSVDREWGKRRSQASSMHIP